MNGNGCAGSIASGVSTGKMWSEEIVFEPGCRSCLRIVAASNQHDVFVFSSPSKFAPAAPADRVGKRDDFLVDPDKLLGGRQPVRTAGRDAGLAPAPLRPATRTMKNSSRLLAEIDKKADPLEQRMAAGSGTSSSTRRLNCSHDSSRLMKRSGARRQIRRCLARPRGFIGRFNSGSFVQQEQGIGRFSHVIYEGSVTNTGRASTSLVT